METPVTICISEDTDLIVLKLSGIIYKPNMSLTVDLRLKPIIIQNSLFVWFLKIYILREYLPVIGYIYIYIVNVQYNHFISYFLHI